MGLVGMLVGDSPERRRPVVLRSPVVHQEVPGVLHTVVQLLICCGLPWELLGGPEEPKGGVLASPWRPTGPAWSP